MFTKQWAPQGRLVVLVLAKGMKQSLQASSEAQNVWPAPAMTLAIAEENQGVPTKTWRLAKTTSWKNEQHDKTTRLMLGCISTST